MQKRIEGFCRKITVAYDIDNDIKEELYGHIEDKLLDYLNGEVKLTEDDAFVLVREHFGNPETVKVLLMEAHEHESQKSSVRELLTNSVLVMSAGTIVSWFLSGIFIKTITKLSLSLPLAHTIVIEPLLVRLQISIVMGILMVLPFLSYNLLSFLAPGQYVGEKKRVVILATFASLCFIAGASLFVVFIVPYLIGFITAFMDRDIEPLLSINGFIKHIINLSMLIGVLFELPVISFMLAKIGILTHAWLVKKRAYVLVAIFIASALLTPPDPLSQIMLAIPLIILFEISIKVARMTQKYEGLEIT